METKGVTCKIPLDLHNQISEEIRETESTMSKFIEMIIREHYEKGANRIMEKGRTLAFQVSEELFQRVKEYLENYEKTYHRRLTQKEFVISLIEQALEEAEEEFEAARAAQEEARANRFNPLTGSFYGEADDTEAENPAESSEINEGEEIPAEGDDSDENCPDEDDEDAMPESWEQDDDEEEETEPADESPEDEETAPDDDTVETGETNENEEAYA
ncbi:MAG: hypothetical protein ACLUIO_15375 [Neglectibacter timonensis]